MTIGICAETRLSKRHVIVVRFQLQPQLVDNFSETINTKFDENNFLYSPFVSGKA
jgi:UDP-N-acetylglucosamine transferase subunit ALG13